MFKIVTTYKISAMSTVQPTDAELLSCPEAIEPQLIHRGRRDIVSPQAGK